MKFKMVHENYNVVNLKESIAFYEKALGLHEASRREEKDFTLVYLADDTDTFQLELTEIHGRKEKYNLGECEFHLAFSVDDFQAAYNLHKEMGCICYENTEMGIYFIIDPDGYWLEIVPSTLFQK